MEAVACNIFFMTWVKAKAMWVAMTTVVLLCKFFFPW